MDAIVVTVYGNGEIQQELIERIDIIFHQDIIQSLYFSHKLSDAYVLKRLKKRHLCLHSDLVGMGKTFLPNLYPLEMYRYVFLDKDAFYRDYVLDKILSHDGCKTAKEVFEKFNKKEGLIPRSLLRNKLFPEPQKVLY